MRDWETYLQKETFLGEAFQRFWHHVFSFHSFLLLLSKLLLMTFLVKASLVAQLVKTSPAIHETPVRFLGREDPLEKGMAMYARILAWRIP